MGWRCSDAGSQHPGGSRWTSRLCNQDGLYSHDDRRPRLERKFAAKQRNRNKPGVVLCSSMEQLTELAELNDEILTFYQTHWDSDILLGCILPWREEVLRLIPDATTVALAMDSRGTSCFVIKFGRPSN
jgi:tRNA A37 threonylcarbamoyladenosine synthetase subunit TsaC/SUA5/YrdC